MMLKRPVLNVHNG